MTEQDKQSDWIKSISQILLKNSQAEAVSVDSKKDTVSVATLGQVSDEDLKNTLQETLKSIRIKELGEEDDCDCDSGSPLIDCRVEGGKVILSRKTCPTAPHFWKWKDYPVSGESHGSGSMQEEAEDMEADWKLQAKLAAGCALGVLLGFVFSHMGYATASVISFVFGMICGGFDAAKDVRENLPKGEFDIHFLMLVVAIGASCIGHWGEGAILLLLFSVSGALEHYTMARTQRAISSLFKAAPKTANVLDAEGKEKSVPVEEVRVGDMIFVRPGDTIPLDAEVLEGESATDESQLTGEANPVAKKSGNKVFSGTQNLWGAMKCRVSKRMEESSLQKIIQLIQDAQHQKAPSQRFTDKFGTKYTIAILLATMGMFLVWWLLVGLPPFENTGDQKSAFYRAMTLLVVASPCALVISIPSAILSAIAFGARIGVLFRGGAAIERLCEVNTVALDKTGTLTTGELAVEQVDAYPSGHESEIIEVAVALEQNANHPIARAIVQYGQGKKVVPKAVASFQTLLGKGLTGRYNDQEWVLGRRELIGSGPLSDWAASLPHPSAEYAEVWVIGGNSIGRILLKDQIRKESSEVLKQMHDSGLTTVMLTGDRRETAENVGRQLGIDEVRSGLSPEGKVTAIREMVDSGKIVAMVGDGVNDAPSLAMAHVAVSMGVRGSDAALEQSDVVLMNDRIDMFLDAYKLSQRANRIIKQNLIISLGTVLIMVASSLLSGIPLTLGVFAHEGSTVVVCLNSIRLLFGKRKKQ